jgi:hypothetical protein
MKFYVLRMFDDESQEIRQLLSDENRTNHRSQALNNGVIHLLADGRAVEVTTDTRGCWLFGVHGSLADALNYKTKQCDAVRLEQF